MNTKGSVLVLFLCFLTLFTLTDCSTCDIRVLEGDSLTFKLTDGTLGDRDRFTITNGSKVIIYKKKKSDTGPWTVKNDKFLELQPAKLNDSGTYTVEVIYENGHVLTQTQTVCVYAQVPKPTLNIACQNEKVNFRCDVEGAKKDQKDQQSDLSYSWTKNGKEFKKTVVNRVENVVADNSKYTCTAYNPVHNSTSDPVEATCSKSNTLFDLDFWFMVGLIVCGGALILILFIVMVIVSFRSCKS